MSMYIERTEVDSDKAPVILWDNLLEDGTLAASSEDTNGEKENAIDGNTYDYWIPTSLPATLSVTLASSSTLGYVGIAAHTLGTNGNTVDVEYHNGVGWVSLASISPTDDKTILIAVAETSATQFRLYISGGSIPNIGVVSFGSSIKFESGILPAYTPLYMAEEIELLTSQTLNGQFVTNRVNRKGAKGNFGLNILERSFVEGTDFQNFRRHYNDGKPFFFASNPSELAEDVSYCWRQDGGEIRPTFESDGIFYKTQLSLEAYLGN